MKNKFFRRVFSVVFSVLLILSTVGCGGNKGSGDVNELTLFRWDFSYVNTAKKMNSSIYEKVSSAIGGVELTAITTGSDTWEDTIQRRFNTNELPDLFITKGAETPVLYQKMIEDEAIVAISDYVSEDKYPNLYKQLSKYGFLKDNVYYSQGKHWSVPISWSLEFAMYVRTDWIDNLNKTEKLTKILTEELGHAPSADELANGKFKEPDNLVEFYRLARAFTLYDPDENGKNDTYGYSSHGEGYSDNWIYEAFGGYNHMIKVGDSYTNSSITDGNKEAVAFINRLLCEGIMDPDWATNSVDDKQTKFMQGKVGMMFAHTWYNTILSGFMAANSGETIESATEKIDMIEPPAGEDGTRGAKGHPNFWTAICINADIGEAKIQKALELLDYLHSDEGRDLFLYGIEGEHYEVNSDGEKVSLMGKNTKGFNYTLLSYEKATVLGTYAWWTSDYYSPYATNSDKIISIMDKAKEYCKYDTIPYLQTPKYVEYMPTLDEYFETSVTQLVSNKELYDSSANSTTGKVTWGNLINVSSELESKWSSYKSEYLNKYKGSEVIDEYNEYAKNLGY